MENNKLIAEFMGMEFGDDGTMCYDDAENLHPPTPTDMLAFHTSWDWLMPVVESCFERLDDRDNSANEIKRQLLVCNLKGVHTAVVEFIKEYNG